MAKTHRSVIEIAEEMKQIATTSESDPEVAHTKADDLLCEALLSISVHIERFQIRDLLTAYKHVEKC